MQSLCPGKPGPAQQVPGSCSEEGEHAVSLAGNVDDAP
jgi:hypothetical protein